MNISSAPPSYSITSTDTITLSNTVVSGSTITVPGAGSGYSFTNGTGSSYYTINTGAGVGGMGMPTVNITGGSEWIWKSPTEFVDCFPEWARIEQMCKEYPGLKIAFEKFKTTYQLVKDHYDTPADQRPRP